MKKKEKFSMEAFTNAKVGDTVIGVSTNWRNVKGEVLFKHPGSLVILHNENRVVVNADKVIKICN